MVVDQVTAMHPHQMEEPATLASPPETLDPNREEGRHPSTIELGLRDHRLLDFLARALEMGVLVLLVGTTHLEFLGDILEDMDTVTNVVCIKCIIKMHLGNIRPWKQTPTELNPMLTMTFRRQCVLKVYEVSRTANPLAMTCS